MFDTVLRVRCSVPALHCSVFEREIRCSIYGARFSLCRAQCSSQQYCARCGTWCSLYHPRCSREQYAVLDMMLVLPAHFTVLGIGNSNTVLALHCARCLSRCSARCSVLALPCSLVGARFSVIGARYGAQCSVLALACSVLDTVLGARINVIGARSPKQRYGIGSPYRGPERRGLHPYE